MLYYTLTICDFLEVWGRTLRGRPGWKYAPLAIAVRGMQTRRSEAAVERSYGREKFQAAVVRIVAHLHSWHLTSASRAVRTTRPQLWCVGTFVSVVCVAPAAQCLAAALRTHMSPWSPVVCG